jgi:hypothetical protein
MNTDDQGKEILNSFVTCATPCPHCGDTDPEHREMRNYNIAFHDGDIYCTSCGGFVRMFDAG